MIVYKYLPAKFLPNFFEHGEILFRNLCYFRSIEGDLARGDYREGMHIDAPKNMVTITKVATGEAFQVEAAMVRNVEFEKVFIFCLSKTLSPSLMKEFAADACVRILDIDAFIQRCRKSLRSLQNVDSHGLLCKSVKYYDHSKDPRIDITDPKEVSFLKSDQFSSQEEYRLAFADDNGFRIPQRQQSQIIMKHALDAELRADIERCPQRQKVVSIGRLNDIAEVVSVTDQKA